MATRHEEGCSEENLHIYMVLLAKGYRTMTLVGRGTEFRETRPGAVFKAGYFVKARKVGGATSERLKIHPNISGDFEKFRIDTHLCKLRDTQATRFYR